METFHDYRDFPASLLTSLTIGNFDGLHRGHREILNKLLAIARQSGTRSLVVTFSPHPLQILQPSKAPKSILLQDEKIQKIREAGIDYLLDLRFDRAFSKLSGESFIREVLVGSLHARHVLVGEDFVFGHRRSGDVGLLRRLSSELGYVVDILEPVIIRGKRVSSTWIRELILNGRISDANRLLGGYYHLCGEVIPGDKLGQTRLVPTLNLAPQHELIPQMGVYVTRAAIEGRTYRAVTNIGTRPTVSGKSLRIETYLINESLGTTPRFMEIEFLHRLRDEMSFPSIEALKIQIQKDVLRAIRFFTRLELFRKGELPGATSLE
ncbi:MAG: bifunctional riboflavin kinase/FAD synthetase [Terriglobia bacterium]